MFEETVIYSVGSLNIFRYGIFIAIGALAALIVFALLCRSRSLPGDIPLLWGVLAIPIGRSSVFLISVFTGWSPCAPSSLSGAVAFR